LTHAHPDHNALTIAENGNLAFAFGFTNLGECRCNGHAE
jgi:hypothetical protein